MPASSRRVFVDAPAQLSLSFDGSDGVAEVDPHPVQSMLWAINFQIDSLMQQLMLQIAHADYMLKNPSKNVQSNGSDEDYPRTYPPLAYASEHKTALKALFDITRRFDTRFMQCFHKMRICSHPNGIDAMFLTIENDIENNNPYQGDGHKAAFMDYFQKMLVKSNKFERKLFAFVANVHSGKKVRMDQLTFDELLPYFEPFRGLELRFRRLIAERYPLCYNEAASNLIHAARAVGGGDEREEDQPRFNGDEIDTDIDSNDDEPPGGFFA